MALGKWIGGFLGFITTGSVLGAIAGYAIGSLFDRDDSIETYTRGTQGVYTGSNQQAREFEGQQNSFRFALMVLSAHIIQADGKIMHSEMELVRKFLRNSFGESAVTQGEEILLRLFEYRKNNGEASWNSQIQQACNEIRRAMPEEHRMQLVAFLAEIVKADGRVEQSELQALREVTSYLGLSVGIVDQMFALGGTTLDEAYAVLGISKDATDDEVRRAYKQMVVKNHPDRVAALGEDVKKAATLKLQEINKAKEIIYKSRNM